MGVEWQPHVEWLKHQKGASLRVQIGSRWVRIGAYYGIPPGSHIGVWWTRMGDLNGINVRLGRRYVGPCLTAFVHTRHAAPVRSVR